MFAIHFGSGKRRAGQGMKVGSTEGGGILCKGNGMSKGERWEQVT